jgi:hypothetical protein
MATTTEALAQQQQQPTYGNGQNNSSISKATAVTLHTAMATTPTGFA